jgi:hypothetical protein
MFKAIAYRPIFITMTLFLLVGTATWAQIQDAAEQGRALAQAVHDRPVGDDVTIKAVMELIDRNDAVRRRDFDMYGMETAEVRRQLIRFTSPADIAGTGFLVLEEGDATEQFLYLPALRRTRRIVASQKGHSFVNSDFSYEDMERRPVDTWSHQLMGSELVGSVETQILDSRPDEGTDSSYTRVRSWIVEDIAVPVKIEFFGRNDRHLKTYTVLSLQNIQGYWTETKIQMEDVRSGHRTVITNLETTYDTGLSHDLFTQRHLESW